MLSLSVQPRHASLDPVFVQMIVQHRQEQAMDVSVRCYLVNDIITPRFSSPPLISKCT